MIVLTASDYAFLAALVYFSMTAVTYGHPAIPTRMAWWPFFATVVLVLVSKHPALAYLIDRSEAREAGFIFAILIGIGILVSLLYRAHTSDCRSHAPPDPDTHE